MKCLCEKEMRLLGKVEWFSVWVCECELICFVSTLTNIRTFYKQVEEGGDNEK